MIGHKFLNAGMRGFSFVMANDDWQAPPPIPIVRDETAMMRSLQAEYSAVHRQEKTCCLVISRPDTTAEATEADILEAVGERFSRGLRPYDGLFAFGSDRFLISLPHIQPEDAIGVMERLRENISRSPLQAGIGGNVAATISLGGTMIDPTLPLQDNIDRADQALFEAWREGGDRVCLWSPDLDAP